MLEHTATGRLRREDTGAQARAAGSPTGQIPVLKDGEVTVWDSLAICEYLADRYPAARLWPTDPAARALARAASCEMHAGFTSLRGECPMDLSLRTKADLSEATQANIRRICELWNTMLARFGGPFLAGEWSIADAFFTPVATRFRTYGAKLSPEGQAYCDALLGNAAFLEWEQAAKAETVRIEAYDNA